jgi:membrane protein involved in colicin uptake
MFGFSLIKLIIYGVIAAAVMGALFAAWVGFKHWVAAPYVEEQRQADKKIVDAMEVERDDALRDKLTAKGNQDRCEAAMQKQTEAQARVDAQTALNFAAAKRLREEQVRKAAATAAQEADLRARASAAPRLLACEQERDIAKATLRDTLKARSGQPIAPAAK